MIKSMTGFASVTREDDTATVGVTVRAVNHRYLDLQLRVPPAFAAFETRLRSVVQQRVARGRLEVVVNVQPRRQATLEVELNAPLLEALRAAVEKARADGHVEGTLTPGDILRFPQALTIRERTAGPGGEDESAAALAGALEAAVAAALEELEGMRVREGGYLRADLDARRALLGDLFRRAEEAAREGIALQRARLLDRLAELRSELQPDEALVAQEVARFLGRSDISEEVVRFQGHLEHWAALSDAPEPCGRKLDFLLQEMNREVNTVGSKAEGPRVSEVVVELKAELEKMREQVQNVE